MSSSSRSTDSPSPRSSAYYASRFELREQLPTVEIAEQLLDLRHVLAKLGTKPLEVGHDRVVDILLGVLGELDRFDVEFFGDQGGV